jgi:arylsulfatase A-like enzyme
LLFGCLLVGIFDCRREAEGPIVIYLVDTLRPDRLPLYGGPRDTAPAASELARDGVTFSNAFSISTWTRPSVATLLTSALPSQIDALNRYGRLRESAPGLPVLLHSAGWQTVAFVANGNIFDQRLGFQKGFDIFEAITIGKKQIAREAVEPALRYIERQKSSRFFLYVHVIDPHQPISLEPSYRKLFADQPSPESERETFLLDYDRGIRQADDQFQRIVTALRRKGWWHNATVIYTSDHGEEFFEHGNQGHGRTVFEEQLRIPLIIKFPGNAKRATRRSDPATLADLAPTVAEIAGLSPSPSWIGASLRQPTSPGREIYLSEELDDVRVFGLRQGQRKLVVQLYPSFERRLYDLNADPGESNGVRIPCERTVDAPQEFLRLFDRWRRRDASSYPGLTIEKISRVPIVLSLQINLAATPEPFVAEDDVCRFSPFINGTTLRSVERIGGESPYRLQLTTNMRGDAPAVGLTVSSAEDGRLFDLGSPTSPVKILRTEAHFIRGKPTDEIARRLKSLGYLGGVGSP